MRNTVVFISSDFESAQKQKIAEMLRIRQIQITDNMQNATIILQPKKAEDTDTLLQLENVIHQYIFEKMPDIVIPKPVLKTHKKTYNQKHAKIIQFNKVLQRQKQFLTNRTRNK